MAIDIDKFVHDQLSVWPELAGTMRRLKNARTRQLPLGGLNVTLQCNPDRISSTTADVTREVLDSRPCPICAQNRPECQHFIRLEGRKRRKYDLIVNRFPIFQRHFVIVREEHEPQSIWHRYVDMLDMAEQLPSCVVFYNGPKSGASIPDHLHFQAVRKGYMPLERSVDRLLGLVGGGVPAESLSRDLRYITCVQDAQLFHYRHFTHGVFALRATTSKSMAKMFYRLLDCAPFVEGEDEPRFNVLTWFTDGEYRAVVVIRSKSRSHHYFAEGEEHFTIAPGCADMGGYFILPDPSDFERLTPDILREIVDEVSISEETERQIIWRLVRSQPKIEVGIMSGAEIWFEVISDGAGPQKVSYCEGKIQYNGALYDELYFEAQTISTLFAEPSFILKGVTIGVGFHWERKQDQTFAGTLKFIVDSGKVTAVNIVGIEDYLLSVISSEMKATSDLEFLKAHAVISRSWVYSQLEARKNRSQEIPFAPDGTPQLVTYLECGEKRSGDICGNDASGRPFYRIVKWFDHDDHKRFDLCADDHCQRYQGLTLAIGENVRKAIDETWGTILTFDGKICDTRFSKCCGGRMEEFSTCWEDENHPYLRGDEDPFCDTHDEAVLSKVLNDYDLETKDFHDWQVEYGVEGLSELISRRSGIGIGTLTALIPLERGVSGRIKLLRIEGTKATIEVGKELMIRRFLSESHLKSSAFDVEMTDGKVILRGHGWGHGVGLCQIGAAVMASRGYTYDAILSHYYPGAELTQNE